MITLLINYALAYICIVGLILAFFHGAVGDEGESE
jgi:hypothetical protein